VHLRVRGGAFEGKSGHGGGKEEHGVVEEVKDTASRTMTCDTLTRDAQSIMVQLMTFFKLSQ
jgi:hypothetical protein